jgi:large subunit ribosomal protein L6
MSRVGKKPISLPKGVEVKIDGDRFTAKGPKGTVSQGLLEGIEVKVEDGSLVLGRANDSAAMRSRHGLLRSLLANAVTGVSEGWTKRLQIIGVGYRADVQGNDVVFALGYSHPVVYPIPKGIQIEVDKSNNITVTGPDRQQVGQVAAEIRSLRKPDAYKGKGIRYENEIVRRKVGKAGAAA